MIDLDKKIGYNDVKVVFEGDKTIFKLRREGKLIYIGVTDDRKDLQRVGNTCNGGHGSSRV
jgi:hypothetical protein